MDYKEDYGYWFERDIFEYEYGKRDVFVIIPTKMYGPCLVLRSYWNTLSYEERVKLHREVELYGYYNKQSKEVANE